MSGRKLNQSVGIFLGILIVVMGIFSGASLVGSFVARPAFRPTPGPVSVAPTYTPTVTYTPTNTPTSTDTPIPTPTSTLTPVNTPTPTSTGILPPTETPTPMPDAVVKAEALNLRSGPGVVYDILGVLKQGDLLKVVAKDPSGKWLQVICPKGMEGWVNASLLEINLPLAGMPTVQPPPTPTPMPTPTATPTPALLPPPILLEPENGAAFIGAPVLLKWQWHRPLAPDEIFSIRVYKEGEWLPCHNSQVQGLEYWGGLTYCSAGTHYWRVAVVRKLCEDCPEHRMWEIVSEPSEERWFYYVPAEEPWTWPTLIPPGADGGDDGGGSSVPGG